jgi:transaldolase
MQEVGMNNIQSLHKYGASIWLDFISRGLLARGELQSYLDLGVTGVTSNPSIFQKSICETQDYDDLVIQAQRTKTQVDINALYEKLAIADIQGAADLLMPIYDSTKGRDGYVSFEVSPDLAYQTERTISEAVRLWNLIKRPNLMIKVPATREGLPAIESLIAQGINVNATLIFSLKQYEAAALAYIRGLEKNRKPEKVASVASYFISRIDTAVDKLLEKNSSRGALALRGKIAVDCAKVAYKKLDEIFFGEAFEEQRKRGAMVQRMVWGSTGTKNPNYSDVLYVDEIIGSDTTNTAPVSTIKAFLDHGHPRLSILENMNEAEAELDSLKKYGINLETVTDQLEKEGVQSFSQAFAQLLESLKGRCTLD